MMLAYIQRAEKDGGATCYVSRDFEQSATTTKDDCFQASEAKAEADGHAPVPILSKPVRDGIERRRGAVRVFHS